MSRIGCCAALCVAIGASAGEIVGVSGDIAVIEPPVSVVPPGPAGSASQIVVFREAGPVALTGWYRLAISEPGLLDEDNEFTSVIDLPAGTGVTTHYIAYTASGGGACEGSITFDRDILGAAFNTGDLSGGSLGAPGTEYMSGSGAGQVRLEFRSADHQPDRDAVEISADRRTLWVRLNAEAESGAGDHLRVVTAADVFECVREFDGAGSVAAMAHYGGALHRGGLHGVARWTGDGWETVGAGVAGAVRALAVFDDGSGEALYAGGEFASAGGTPAIRIARWDGSSWNAVGGGAGIHVDALCVFDDGGGPALYAAGSPPMAGGIFASRVMRWDGDSWAQVGGLMNNLIRALAVHDDGGGPALYVGGRFVTIGGAAARRIARWDGSAWAEVGGGVNSEVSAIASHDDGAGAALFIGGYFTETMGGEALERIGEWDGDAWRSLGDGLDRETLALASRIAQNRTPALFVGGMFDSAGGVMADGLAAWTPDGWRAVDAQGAGDGVCAAIVVDPASRHPVFGGEFGAFVWRGCAEECRGDATGDGIVDFRDLQVVLSGFGGAGAGDLDGDGVVGFGDLQIVLAAFGVCVA